jgi:hypothetical protein
MEREKIKRYLIKYLAKKDLDFDLTEDYNSLVLRYFKHDIELKIELYIDYIYNYNNEGNYYVRYYTNYHVQELGRRRTKTNGSYGNRVYKNLNFIIGELNKTALRFKEEREKEKKYCTELLLHYKRKHDNVSLNVSDYSNVVTIVVYCNDKDGTTTNYHIEYKENKYYLKSKNISFTKY